MIKERFKVSWGPVPSSGATAAVVATQTQTNLCLLFRVFGGQGFNDGLEELCKTQKAWAIPDTEQRDKIRQAQKHIVKETYGAFLHRWAPCPHVPSWGSGLPFRKSWGRGQTQCPGRWCRGRRRRHSGAPPPGGP